MYNENKRFINQLIQGDCLRILKEILPESVDLVITDPPYLVNYRSRDGRSITNDDYKNDFWLRPAFKEIYQVLKKNSLCVSFLGFTQAEKFITAWKTAGFRILEHLVWRKNYASSFGFTGRCHESAYLLAKGKPEKPQTILPSVLPWPYSGNRLHPTQKPIKAITPLIKVFSKPGDIVLDPFSGSGTTAMAAKELKRRYIGIELSPEYHKIAKQRLEKEG